MTARRYDTNKLRYDLVADSLSNIVEVYTKGAAKYTLYQTEDGSIINGNDPTLDLQSGKYTLLSDGANNWKKGLSWSKTIAAVQRHIAEWKLGNDHDPDLGTKHLANAAWGLLALMEYEKIHPELDDRITYKIPKIGLDIDSVLNEFDTYFLEYLGLDLTPQVHWNDPRFRDPNNWEKINTPDFWELNLKVGYDFTVYKNIGIQLNAGVRNIFNAYQKDFDRGSKRDSGYIYGPGMPRSYFAGVKISY